MNNLIEMSCEMTMGTREIADLLGKQHHHIKASADYLVSKKAINGGVALAETPYVNEQNKQTYTEYRLNKRDSLILVAQNCPEFTAAIVDRWQELEEQAKPQVPQTYAAALLEAGRLAMELEQSQQQLAIAAPKAEFVDRYVDSSGTYTFRQVAKMTGVKENAFREFLLGGDNPVMYRLAGRLTPYANHVEAGRFIQRIGVADNDHSYTESRFTTRGVEWIAGEMAKAGAKKQLVVIDG